ncbi:UNVERIFIED_CONTAM: Hexose carrier protein HEX6 [Sesamum angustifolium]|uniref:Hexose carrier protein HEX6 n=1 Tax=Sesamum angustifolium TaxID=2727405 RepID=A0AAW2PT46_9LAMI
MAVGLEIRSDSRHYNGRITLFALLSCTVAATGGIIFGYDVGVSGGVTSMEPFLKKFFPKVYMKMKHDTNISNYCKFDSQLLTSFTSSLYIAGLVTSFFASSVTQAFGRKPSIVIGGAAFVLGAALGGAARNIYMLIFGRALLGVGLGFTNQAVPLYLSEMALPRHRGAFNAVFQICVNIGFIMATLINYGTVKIRGGWGWRISLAMAGAPAAILAVGALFLPETPSSLIQHSNNHEKAERALQIIRGTNNVQVELDDLIEASHASKSIKHPYKNLMQRKYRPQLVMSIAIPFFQQVTGINVIAFYAPVLFRSIGSGESASLMSTIVIGLAGTSFTLLTSFLVDRLGRRALFHVGGVQMFVSQMLIGGIMAAKLGDHGGLSKGYGVVVLILICVYVAGFGLSWGPLGMGSIPSNALPFEVRNFLPVWRMRTADDCVVYSLLPETKSIPLRRWRESGVSILSGEKLLVAVVRIARKAKLRKKYDCALL